MADGRRCPSRRGLRIFLPSELRLHDARPLFIVVLAVLMVALIVGDPGRIDRQKTWLRVLTGVLIGVITLVNAGSSVLLVYAIITTEPFTNDATDPTLVPIPPRYARTGIT